MFQRCVDPINKLVKGLNIKEKSEELELQGHSKVASIIGASAGIATQSSLFAGGASLMAVGAAVAPEALPVAALALSTGYEVMSKSEETAKVVSHYAPILVDSTLDKFANLYSSAANFVQEAYRRYTSGSVREQSIENSCYPLPPSRSRHSNEQSIKSRWYPDIESVMIDSGFHQHADALYKILNQDEQLLYAMVVRDLFQEQFTLNSNHMVQVKSHVFANLKHPVSPADVKQDVINLEKKINEKYAPSKAYLALTPEQQLREFKAKAALASKAQKDLVTLVQKNNASPFELSSEIKAQLTTIAKPLHEFGTIGIHMSAIARQMGGHTRTWQGVSHVSEGFLSMASGLSLIANSGTYVSLGALTGGMSILLGAMTIGMSLMGDDKEESNGLAVMMGAIQAMHQEVMSAFQVLHRDMMAEFKRLETIILQNMAVSLSRLNEINSKLDRLEHIVAGSFQELHTQDLINRIDALTKAMRGELRLKDNQVKKHLQKLSTWIDFHSNAKIQTSLLRDSKEVSKCVELLNSKDFDLAAMLPFFMIQLSRLVPNRLFEQAKIEELPNVAVLTIVCEVYANAIAHYQFDDNFGPCLTRAMARLESVLNLIEAIKNEQEQYLELLSRQYEQARFQVGRAIYECRQEFTVKTGASLASQLQVGINTEHLMAALDQLELRRVMLLHLCELCDIKGELWVAINKLESKKTILERPAEAYAVDNNLLFQTAAKGQLLEFKRLLEMGASVNAWDSFGQAIHYLARDGYVHKPEASLMLHLLQKTQVLETKNPTKQAYQTWGNSVRPIQWMLNVGSFDLAVLFCANGDDISESKPPNPCCGDVMRYDFCNAFYWAEQGNWQCIVQKELVHEMNSEGSPINKKAMRQAYSYYKMAETGVEVSAHGVSIHCLLVLVAILGDLRPLKMANPAPSVLQEAINRPLTASNFTSFLLAVVCGREQVFDYFIEKGAQIHANRGIITAETPLLIAIENKYWGLADKLATRLSSQGVRLKTEQTEAIRAGMRSQSNSMHSVCSPTYLHTLPHNAVIPKTFGITSIALHVKEIIARLDFTNASLKFIPALQTQALPSSAHPPGLPSPLDTSSQPTAPNHSVWEEDLVRVFKQAKIFYMLIAAYGQRISQEQDLIRTMVNEQILALKTSIDQLDKLSKPTDLKLLKNLSSDFNLLDGLLRSMPELNYSLGTKIDLMLMELNPLLATKNEPIPQINPLSKSSSTSSSLIKTSIKTFFSNSTTLERTAPQLNFAQNLHQYKVTELNSLFPSFFSASVSAQRTQRIDACLKQNGLKRGIASGSGNNCLLDTFYQEILYALPTAEQNLGSKAGFITYVRNSLGGNTGEMLSLNDEEEGKAIVAAITAYLQERLGVSIRFDFTVLVADQQGDLGFVDMSSITALSQNDRQNPQIIPIWLIFVNYNHYEPLFMAKNENTLINGERTQPQVPRNTALDAPPWLRR